MKTTQQLVALAIIFAGAFFCEALRACVVPGPPTLCEHVVAGWDPGHTAIHCSFGSVSITFDVEVCNEAVDIYTPHVSYGETGVNEFTGGPNKFLEPLRTNNHPPLTQP